MQAIYIYDMGKCSQYKTKLEKKKSQEIKPCSLDDSPLVIGTATNYTELCSRVPSQYTRLSITLIYTIPNYLLASLYFSLLYKCKEQTVVL